MRSILVVILASALVLPLVPPAGAGAPAPCDVADWVPDTTAARGAPGEYVRVRFAVREALEDATIWGAVAWHGATTAVTPPLYYGYAAERAAAVLFVESATGALLGDPAGFQMYPYGVQLSAADLALRVTEQDADICGSSAAGATFDLPPGEYVATVLAGADTPNGGAVLLPSAVEVLSVTTGPLQVVSEASLACDAKAHAMALGFSSAALVGCEQRFVAQGRGFHGIFSGRFPDPTHQVRWDPSVGALRQIAFFDGRIEPAGDSALLVPQYVTPAGNPLYLPLPVGQPAALGSDSGIFGFFADVAG